MVVSDPKLCNYIRSKGKYVKSKRGLDYFGMIDSVQNGKVNLDHISLPRFSKMVKKFKIQGYFYAGFAISKSNKVYTAIYLKLNKDQNESLVFSFWNHGEEGWLIDFRAMLLMAIGFQRRNGIKEMKYRYRDNWKIAPYVEKWFGPIRGTEFKTLNHMCVMNDVVPLTTSPWTNRKIPEGCEFEVWHELSYKKLEDAFAEGKFKGYESESLSPFQLRDKYDMQYSHLIYFEEELVGWSILHSLKEDLVQITTLYVDHPKCQWMGLRSLSMAVQKSIKQKKVMKAHFLIEDKNARMKTFYVKVLLPLGVIKSSIMEASLKLSEFYNHTP